MGRTGIESSCLFWGTAKLDEHQLDQFLMNDELNIASKVSLSQFFFTFLFFLFRWSWYFYVCIYYMGRCEPIEWLSIIIGLIGFSLFWYQFEFFVYFFLVLEEFFKAEPFSKHSFIFCHFFVSRPSLKKGRK